MTTPLEPCPFCGHDVQLKIDPDPDQDNWRESPYIWCETCNRTFDLVTGFEHPNGFPTTADFLAWWNTRAQGWQP